MTASGPRFAGLIPIVAQNVPRAFHVVAAHQCRYRQSRFVHLTLTDGRKMRARVLTKSSGVESRRQGALIAAANSGGSQVFTATSNRFYIAPFESGGHFAYVVSGNPVRQNLEVAAATAPAVGRLLSQLNQIK